MNALLRRYDDWRHERYIARLATKVERLIASGSYMAARVTNDELTSAITARSPQQVARMEKASGLR